MKWFGIVVLILCLCVPAALAETYSASIAEDWLLNLADYLMNENTLNDPAETGDLTRPGQYLLQYDFGTVITENSIVPERGSIVEVKMESGKIADCLGHTVGMSIRTMGITVDPVYPLNLISVQQEGIGWLWVYSNDGNPYGVEWVSYRLTENQATEYTLTYSVENEVVSAIRIRKNEMTVEEAKANLASVGELDAAQRDSARAVRNDRAPFSETDALLNGRTLIYAPVDQLAMLLGDPTGSQNLPAGQGRLLLYDGLVVSCNLEEQTGVELIYGFTAVSDAYTGPRNIRVGMTLREAAGLFRCDRTVTTAGGTLYINESDESHLPKGQLIRFEDGQETLVYGCLSRGKGLWLEITCQADIITAWRLYFSSGLQMEDAG